VDLLVVVLVVVVGHETPEHSGTFAGLSQYPVSGLNTKSTGQGTMTPPLGKPSPHKT
jgi:hypothetical protein